MESTPAASTPPIVPAVIDHKKKRPLALTIALVLIILSAIVDIAIGGLLFYLSDLIRTGQVPGAVVEYDNNFVSLDDQTELLLYGTLYLLIGLGELVISVGFARQRKWAWVAAMTWQAINLLINEARIFIGNPEPVTMVFAILLVFVLNQSDVRRAFDITHQPSEPSTTTPISAFDSN